MSSFIPFEIQMKIIKVLPVISLIQFRSVSKTWKSFIDSSQFIAAYRFRLHHPQLFIKYRLRKSNDVKYVSFVDDDDDTFPQIKSIFNIPPLVQQLIAPQIIGSSHGLLCLSGYFEQTEMVVIWNPAIRKSIAVDLHIDYDEFIQYVISFGVCPKTKDPKILKFTNSNDVQDMQVEVFSLSLGEWRIPRSNLLPRESIIFEWFQVAIGQFIYWLAYEKITKEHGLVEHNYLIMSFDMCTEEFKEINLPDCLKSMTDLSICKLEESLVVLEYSTDTFEKRVCHVWRMEDGVPKLFTNLFTINPQVDGITWDVLGFRKSVEPIMEMIDKNDGYQSKVAINEHGSDHIKDLGINGSSNTFSFHNIYEESLLLLDYDDHYIPE